jgi:hypothetical protein
MPPRQVLEALVGGFWWEMGTQAGSPLSGKNGWLKIHGANPRRTVYECLAYRYLDDFIRQNPLPTEVGVGLGEKKMIMRPRELFFAGARTLQPLTAERHSVCVVYFCLMSVPDGLHIQAPLTSSDRSLNGLVFAHSGCFT